MGVHEGRQSGRTDFRGPVPADRALHIRKEGQTQTVGIMELEQGRNAQTVAWR
jgi:hypothetical protein